MSRVLIDCFGQRRAKARQMRAAIGIRDGIRKRQNLIVVTVIVLQHDIDKHFVTLPGNHDRFRMQHLLVFAQLLYELFDAVFVEKFLLLRRIAALVCQRNFEAGIKEGQFAQAGCQSLELKLGRDGEDRRIRQKRDERSGGFLAFDFTDDRKFVGRFALGKSHVIDFAVPRYLYLEPFRKRVRAFCAHAMQAAGIFISALSKFSAGVQICQHQLDRRHFPFGMNIDGNAAAIVSHRDRSIDMNGHFDLRAKSRKMFVDGVIDDFVNQMMHPTLIRIADEHARPFPDCLEAF